MSSSNNVLITSDGTELPVTTASTTVATNRALLVAGSDGTNNRFITLDSSGRQLVVGAGTAGTAAGGVITIQGVAGGVVVPISNTTLSVVGGGTEAAALRVTIANDSTGVVTVDGTVTSNQGTANSLANAWSMKITDTTNGPVAVKPASTAPSATDQALVVVLSPNQPAIPVTNAPSNSVTNLSMGDVILSSATTSAIRRTAYIEQTVNFTGSIASANANDSAAGTGARTVRIYYVTADGTTEGAEDVTLNGTTGVNLTATKCYIEKIEVLTAGSTGSNVGIISLYTAANKTGTVVGTIAATNNTTFWAHHYIVSGKTCNVTGIYHGNNSTVSGGVSFAVLRSKDLSNLVSVEKQVSDFIGVAGASNPYTRIYGSVIQIPGPARLAMYVTSGAAATVTYRGSFDSYDV
jgi:hypothetical protein